MWLFDSCRQGFSQEGFGTFGIEALLAAGCLRLLAAGRLDAEAGAAL
jgi:hypothetical protein